MPRLVFFNELSQPSQETGVNELNLWSEFCGTMYGTARLVSERHGVVAFVFHPSSLSLVIQNRTLLSWFTKWLGNDKADWLKDKIRRINDYPPELIEVCFEGERSLGLTLTITSDSWCLSIPSDASPWLGTSINAIRSECIDEDNYVEEECEVRNLSLPDHVQQWNDELTDWQVNVSRNNTIYDFGAYRIEMYPNDHGYPHIHLIVNNRTAAKFRVDEFQRLEGKPTWDTDMAQWIRENQDQLLRSWERCMVGKRPISLMNA
jgi:hypothetical protein